MSRTLASTSLRYQEVSAERPQPVAPEKSTYKAILASLTDSLQQKRGPRSSGSSYNEAEDNEAQWETRPVFGEASWPATPYSGRSILVGSDNDVNRAYSSLSSLMARNQVRRELKLTERFEKPNRERNRKKSERHRRRFADMVRKKVQLVSFGPLLTSGRGLSY